MKEILNKTQRALRVPLPQGKVLHLGPNKSGQIAPHAVDHPPLKKLIEAGELEILGDGARSDLPPGTEAAHPATHGHSPDTAVRHRGDR